MAKNKISFEKINNVVKTNLVKSREYIFVRDFYNLEVAGKIKVIEGKIEKLVEEDNEIIKKAGKNSVTNNSTVKKNEEEVKKLVKEIEAMNNKKSILNKEVNLKLHGRKATKKASGIVGTINLVVPEGMHEVYKKSLEEGDFETYRKAIDKMLIDVFGINVNDKLLRKFSDEVFMSIGKKRTSRKVRLENGICTAVKVERSFNEDFLMVLCDMALKPEDFTIADKKAKVTFKNGKVSTMAMVNKTEKEIKKYEAMKKAEADKKSGSKKAGSKKTTKKTGKKTTK